jgi:hypothetical protein
VAPRAVGPDPDPTDPDPTAPDPTGPNELARRCAAAEDEAARLRVELAEAHARIARLTAATDARHADGADGAEGGALSLFDHAADPARPVRGDGTDPRIVSVVLGATAVVAAMVAVLALLNGNLFTWFGLGIVLLTVALAWAALRSRTPRTRVEVSDGVVHAERGGTTYHFDLRSDHTDIEQRGRAGDRDWQLRFLRRHMEPVVIDATMVEAEAFLAEVRRYRPSL